MHPPPLGFCDGGMGKHSIVIFLLCTALSASAGAPASLIEIRLSEEFVLGGYPGDGSFARVAGIAHDSESGEILVADAGKGRIYVFDTGGEPRGILGDASEIPAASAIVAGRGGSLFVLEEKTGRIFVIDRTAGETACPFSLTGTGEGGEFKARAMAGSSHGTLVFAGADERSLVLCDFGGQVLAHEKARGRLSRLVSITMDTRGRILVAVQSSIPFHLYDRSGKFLRNIEVRDISRGVPYADPGGAAFDSRGRIWASFPVENSIRVFDETGAVVSEIESAEIPGGLLSPTALLVTPLDILVVFERGANRIRGFSPGIQP